MPGVNFEMVGSESVFFKEGVVNSCGTHGVRHENPRAEQAQHSCAPSPKFVSSFNLLFFVLIFSGVVFPCRPFSSFPFYPTNFSRGQTGRN